MKTHDAIQHFGNRGKLAAALNITSQAVSQWGENVPPHRALQLEKLTRGALRAEGESPKRQPGMRATTAA
ncbi:Cro/CI family transcriptional regulator [Halomonas organivorans]|uniref:DNA-binding transcriptional regulator YdaS (Cro superfamily) n=1 Tax=Halomonas organivorans TaxID=257772 RepID=A0A7W5C0U3_9GAMM|nr:Cro/CI family transcriptional regulator [Halomonas organivorans]MBB3142795.1 DNA-binding transcriptional regulator YdaS (Cro superfamily) [Halomonas organivorans]